MNWRGWLSLSGYFAAGLGLLLLLGMVVSQTVESSRLVVSLPQARAEEGAVPAPAAEPPPAPPSPPTQASPAVQNPPPVADPVGAPVADPIAATPPEAIDTTALDQGGEGEVVKRDLGILEGIIEDYDYRSKGKRDPFEPFTKIEVKTEASTPMGPVTELERFDLDQLRVVGIIWGVPKPKALVLDPGNKTYVVFNRTRIGRNSGYVAEIREGEVVIVESFNNEGRVTYQPRILKLQRE